MKSAEDMERELEERMIDPQKVAIIEITPKDHRFELCNNKGEIMTAQSYHPNSPLADVVTLLTRLAAIKYTNEVKPLG